MNKTEKEQNFKEGDILRFFDDERGENCVFILHKVCNEDWIEAHVKYSFSFISFGIGAGKTETNIKYSTGRLRPANEREKHFLLKNLEHRGYQYNFKTNKIEEKEHSKEQKYYEYKEAHPDAILLFRCGDFYELYKTDACKAAGILGLVITYDTEQVDSKGKPLLTVGFPHYSLDMYLPKLVRAGCRVAIVDGET